MTHRPARRTLALLTALLVGAGAGVPPGGGVQLFEEGWARSKSSSRSSSSSRSYSSSSSSSRSSWGRSSSSSSSFGSRSSSSSSSSSGGYGKPSSSSSSSSGGGYGKPSSNSSSSGGYAKPSASSSSSSGGYAKPGASSSTSTSSASGYAKPGSSSGGGGGSNAKAGTTAPVNPWAKAAGDKGATPAAASGAAPSSGGYTKPGAATTTAGGATRPGRDAVAAGAASGAAPTSGGYTKPGAGGIGLAAGAAAAAAAASTVTSGSGEAAPSTPATQPASAAPSTPATQPASATTAAKPPPSELDRKVARMQAARALEKQRESQLQARTKEVEEVRRSESVKGMTGGHSYTPETVWRERRTYYSSRGSFPERFHGARLFENNRNYGGMDSGFLMSRLMNNSGGRTNPLFWYALAGIPAAALFLDDAWAEGEERQDQALLDQVTRVREEVARLEKEGVARPALEEVLGKEGVPPAVALRQDVATGKVELPPLRFSTGTEGGLYHAFCQGNDHLVGLRTRATALETQCLNSSGSRENLERLAAAEADAILVQSDAADQWLRDHQQKALGPFQMPIYAEPFLLLVNKKSSIDEVQDLKKGKHVIHVGPEKSGSALSWRNLVHHTAGGKGGGKYTGLETRHGGYLAAAGQVALDPGQVLFMVMGLHSQVLDRIEEQYGDKLKLVPFTEERLLGVKDREGNPVYTSCAIPARTFWSMQEGWIFNEVDSLCVDSLLVLSPRWVEERGASPEAAFVGAASGVIQEVREVAGVER